MNSRYAQFKVFAFPDKVASLARSAPETLPPLHVRIKPTNVCAHRCSYCAYRSDQLALGSTMDERSVIPEQKMFEIVSDLEQMGGGAVTFSGGGDPFYYPPLARVVKRVADGPIRFAALTNGTRLTGELAALFSHHGTWIRVSLDGYDDESYAAYRGVREGEYTKLMENLEAFARLGGPCHLGVSLVVDRDNAPHVEASVARLRDAGVGSVKVSPCIVSNEPAENARYHEPIAPVVRDQIERLKARSDSGDFELFDAYHALDARFDKSYDWCPYLQVLCVIGADLNVYSCQDKAYTPGGLIGSIRDTSFSAFWSDGRDKFFAIDPSRDCRHHCVANDKNRALCELLSADSEHLFFV